MAKRNDKLSARYAKALQKALVDEGQGHSLQVVSTKLEALAKAWSEDPAIAKCLLNPMFSRKDRKAALHETLKILSIAGSLERFLLLLVDKDRLALLPEIAVAFKKIADEASNTVHVSVLTAHSVDEQERKDIAMDISGKIKGNLEFSWAVDSSLIGGVIVSYQGKVLDGSLRGKLSKLERSLMV